MQIELKPCPFCGDTPKEIVDATKFLGVHRMIHRCAVIPPFSLEAATPEEVAAQWNRRALTSATPPDVAGLIERLDVRWEATDEPTARKINRFIRERKEAATALRLSAGGGVPEGWKLVPVEPTPEMIGAFWRQKNCGTQEIGERGPQTDDYSAYRAMLAASPTVEVGHVE